MRKSRRLAGTTFITLYRAWRRFTTKLFSIATGGAFAHFGKGSVIELPVRLDGERRIHIGDDVYIGVNSWLQVEGDVDGPPALFIGSGSSLAGGDILSAAKSVTLGRKVLLARNVYIADHSHAFDDTTRAVLDQGIDAIAPVEIGDGAWLGENVVVGPGVRIGRGAVIGANSVVLTDVEDFAIAVGAPARVVRVMKESADL
jgi:acetyltransferase-like isoleucine patch superfamily enzyme